jgi:hypothetical protein
MARAETPTDSRRFTMPIWVGLVFGTDIDGEPADDGSASMPSESGWSLEHQGHHRPGHTRRVSMPSGSGWSLERTGWMTLAELDDGLYALWIGLVFGPACPRRLAVQARVSMPSASGWSMASCENDVARTSVHRDLSDHVRFQRVRVRDRPLRLPRSQRVPPVLDCRR